MIDIQIHVIIRHIRKGQESLMTDVNIEQAMFHYLDAYQKLYKRQPKDLRALTSDWVLINGAQMSVNDLKQLTRQLQLEYQQGLEKRRNLVNRLIGWFKT